VRTRRRIALVVLACVALLIVIVLALSGGSSEAEALAGRFARQWAHGSYAAMYSELDRASRRGLSQSHFAGEIERAKVTATAAGAGVQGDVRAAPEGTFGVPMRVRTRIFGTLHETLEIHVHSEGGTPRVAFGSSLMFPGLSAGESLHRETSLPPRAPLLARDGSALAEGSPPPRSAAGPRSSPLGAAAEAVAGDVGPIPSAQRSALEGEGVPSEAAVGISGLEATFDARLRGRPGGTLYAGDRVIARATASPAPPLRTTIAPAVQRAAVLALGGQLGGVVAMRPQTGEVLAVAGLGVDDLQPPGSTFKMVTVSAVLQAGVAHPSTTFPDQTATTLDGVTLHNAGGESCGGTLAEAFAVSCNSVFAPLGVKLGAERLVSMAERFGFNQAPVLPGAVESTIPEPSRIRGELALGSTAIGQGEVLASPLEMALVAATIANGGRRPQPTFLPVPSAPRSMATARVQARGRTGAGARGSSGSGSGSSSAGGQATAGVPVISAALAHTVTELMLGVVRYGTGTAAAISGLEVAGKTGTAELGGNGACAGGSSPETGAASASAGEGGEGCAAAERHNTDAWFAAFAPAQRPRIALAAMLVRDGYGGETAAPVARQVIEAWHETEGR
jgi:peptidoglycan glycosyltransferase